MEPLSQGRENWPTLVLLITPQHEMRDWSGPFEGGVDLAPSFARGSLILQMDEEVVVVNSSLPRVALKRKQKHDLRSTGPIKKAKPSQDRTAVPGLDPSAPIHVHEDQLQWKLVSRSNEAGLDDEEGMVLLEEVEGIDVEYEQAGQGKLLKFKVRQSSS